MSELDDALQNDSAVAFAALPSLFRAYLYPDMKGLVSPPLPRPSHVTILYPITYQAYII